MRKTKITKLMLVGMLIFAGIVTGCGRSDTTAEMESLGPGPRVQLPRFESINGTTEFYFRPIDDDRNWHVINRYRPLSSNEGPDYNMASYTFSKDSVCVINEFVGMPELDQWDIGLSGLTLNNNNFKKQN